MNVLRAVACLSVVFLHSIQHVVNYNFGGTTAIEKTLLSIAGLLSAGTPTFIFISIILFAYKYPNNLPNNFYSKRITLILFPFISMAFFYALVETYDNISLLPKQIFYNLIGQYHGWFVLLIFQFYILYHLTIKLKTKISPFVALSTSLAINIIYLAFFNFTNPLNSTEFASFFWKTGFWTPFVGWLFYFSFAYYCGRNYDYFLKTIKKYKSLIIAALLISVLIVLTIDFLQLSPNGSKRIDMIPFTILAVSLMLSSFSKIKKVNGILMIISNYSFGIYLLHVFYLIVAKKIFDFMDIHYGYWSIPLWFIFAVFASIFSVNLVTRLPLGKYILGNVNKSSKKTEEKNYSENKPKLA